MTTYTHTLGTVTLGQDSAVHVYPPFGAKVVTPEDPAMAVMTDLRQVRAITIAPDNSIDFAVELMKHAGVRMLVVAGNDRQLAGLITVRDIMGEKPISIMSETRILRHEIQVQQIMTPLSHLDPFKFSDIEHATVKDVILKLKQAGRQHAIVVEPEENGQSYCLRGIFSSTQIGRQLGMEISADGPVQNFADFEKLIA